MKIRTKHVIMAFLTFVCTQLQAQINEDYQIVFTDDEGVQEIIDVPEAMTDMMSEMDSLMAIFVNSKYLTIDDDCQSTGENPYFSDEVIAGAAGEGHACEGCEDKILSFHNLIKLES